jgi:hypothetical protein
LQASVSGLSSKNNFGNALPIELNWLYLLYNLKTKHMRKLAVFRFGAAELLSGDAAALVPFVMKNDWPLLGTSVGVGFVSFIYSDAGPSDIAKAYRNVEESMDDVLPIIVIDLESDANCTLFPESEMANYFKCLREFEEAIAPIETKGRTTFKIQMTLDELLDLANERGGIDKLTPDELTLLQKLSAQ